MARWAIFCGASFAAFQAWLWWVQGYWLGAAGAFILTSALVWAASSPRTRYAIELGKALR